MLHGQVADVITITEERPSTYKLSEKFVPILPSVIFLMRSYYTPSVEDWEKIVAKAAGIKNIEAWNTLEYTKNYETIIIVDEGSVWAVVFVVFGNGGYVSKGSSPKLSNLTHIFLESPNYIVYLDKETLEAVERPENAIIYLPIMAQTVLVK